MNDIFASDLFSMITLTAAINDVAHVPQRIAQLGWFQEEGILDTKVVIEKEGETLVLVADVPRGSSPQVVVADKREGIPFLTTHLPQQGEIFADEVVGVREFGSTDGRRTIESVRNARLTKMRRQLDATIEFHRIGAIKGKILDSNGTRVIADLFDRFGLSQQTQDMNLDNNATKVRDKCLQIELKVEEALGGLPYSAIRVLCGNAFWSNWITHPKVEETYLGYAKAAELQGSTLRAFEFGGIIWERYRGKVNNISYIGDDEAYAVPEGVPDLMICRYAPADYVEAVGSMGLPYYAKAELKKMGKGIDLEAQSNPINLNTRPRTAIKLYRTAAP
jgi:hypothetical protein